LDLAAARERALEDLTEATARQQAEIARIQHLEAELSSAHTRGLALERELARYRGLTMLRIRDAILRLPVVGPGAHGAGRLLARVLKA
jgi:hypothetical protein